MKRLMMSMTSAVIALSLCASAHAQLTAGVSLGQQSTSDGNYCGMVGFSCKNDDMVGTVRLGLRVLPFPADSLVGQIGHTSIEIAYTNYGTLKTKGPLYGVSDKATWDDKLYSLSLGTAYELRISPSMSFVTRLGVSSFKATENFTRVEGSPSMEVSSRRSAQLYYGLGATYRLNSRIAFTGDLLFSRAPVSGSSSRDIHNVSTGVVYSFN
ncbi:outer membrane beta-barrel protein [Ottowia sp.]|uniref:outer membrane beta-barrel protein n=1 Tax=Ottowia sp. TaxID=1898956 RepID=UPI0025D1DBA0|nr:outer membrane beta-barrel protein [Ottowia sp.]MBK6616581.1 outer membrane beta-barrel protein [Ottowia sp.]